MSETPPDVEQLTATGAEAHYRRLEALYRSAPVNRQFESVIEITGPGRIVYIAGQLGLKPNGEIAGDFRAQVVQAFENL